MRKSTSSASVVLYVEAGAAPRPTCVTSVSSVAQPCAPRRTSGDSQEMAALLLPERGDRVDAQGRSGRSPTGQKRHDSKEDGSAGVGCCIDGLHPE